MNRPQRISRNALASSSNAVATSEPDASAFRLIAAATPSSSCIACSFVLSVLFVLFTPAIQAADDDFFEKRIRPVLIEHCHECHGAKKQKGGLRLDSRAAALTGGDSGAAIAPGKPDDSLLIQALRQEGFEMPPKGKLPDAVIADFVEWVKRGAVWPGDAAPSASKKDGEMVFTPQHLAHWAFQPPKKLAVPQPKNEAWCRTDIDRFILAKLEAAGLQPAPPTDVATLLRRLTFDLTGLPPTPDEVAAFVNGTDKTNRTDGTNLTDKSHTSHEPHTSYQSTIARLLQTPHYGERFARHWLDVARYADSNGSEVDHAMANAWRYRDYVVKAFNDDKPFDQFVREQVAGDLLPDANAESLTATGFLMLGPKALADLDKPKLAADIVDEQIDTLGRAFLGLTIGCCRCHDHKFDPLPTADYYALAGIFTSTRSMVDITKRVGQWTERPLGSAEDAERIGSLLTRIAALQKQRDASGSGAKLKPKLAADAAYLVIEAEDFARGNVRVDADQLGKGIGVVRTRLEYPDHIEYEFEVAAAGEYQLELRYAAKESRPIELSLNGNLEEMSAAAEVTGEWKPDAQRWFVQGRYEFRAGQNTLAIHRDGPVPLFDKILIGKVSEQPHSRGVAATPAAKPTADTKAVNAEKKRLDAAITAAQSELETIPTVMAPFDGRVADAPILIRGSAASPGAIVPRGFPRIVPALAGVGKPDATHSGRLELAHWITHPQNPLTARVIVNRVWQWHFGEGLVRSPDNFGLRGESPSHPELLDWLATWFIDNRWSLKKLHSLICTSAVYRMSGRETRAESRRVGQAAHRRAGPPAISPVDFGGPALEASLSHPTSLAADPDNRLLSHFPRRRLSAEELRDAMLAVSGRLDRTVGGSVMTVMNRTYAAGGNAPGDIVKQMHYDTSRRSLYLPIIRSSLHDFLAVFDYPDPGMLTGRRAQTTVAPQALFLMNSPFVKAQATAFAQRAIRSGDTDESRVRAAYALAFSRAATDAETQAALAFLRRESDTDRLTAPAAWTRLCHALLASNEFLYLR